MKKHFVCLAVFSALIVHAGCVAKLDKPRVPRTLNRNDAHILYSTDEFGEHYKDYKTALGSDAPKARRLRDMMINRIRVDVEMNYREYESQLFFDRGGTNLGGDFLELGLAFAGTVSKGERVKSVLASALSGVRGTRLSYDKNFFREKTIEIIVSKMQATREIVKNRILEKSRSLPADKYTFEEAWVDLAEFFYSGTLQGGVQALANEAGRAAVAAQAETREKEFKFIRTASPEEVASIRVLSSRYKLLETQWQDAATDAEKAKFVEKARAVLKEMQADLTQARTDEGAFKLLRDELWKTVFDRARLPKLATAFRNANI
jgi:hypothetical protein